MAYTRVCAENEVREGEMSAFFLDDWEVLVLRDSKGVLRAMDGVCPHEDFSLAYGTYERDVITCANHQWCFDATTGRGIRPTSCMLDQYALKVEDGEVFVDTESTPTEVQS